MQSSKSLPNPVSAILLELGRARILESTLLTGFVLVSVPFADGFPAGIDRERVGILLLASVLLFASIYAFNSYFGFIADRLNPRLSQFASPRSYLFRGWLFFAGSIPLFSWLNPRLPTLAIVLCVLWTGYSVPGGAKSRPIWGTAVHFVGEVTQFHLGILALSHSSVRSLATSIFFALLFSSGHLVHELKDYASDRKSGIRTNAVAFGPGRIVVAYRAFTGVICAYWLGIYWLGWVEARAFVPFFAASVAHAVTAFVWSASSLERREGNQRFQLTYRFFYLLAGFATFVL